MSEDFPHETINQDEHYSSWLDLVSHHFSMAPEILRKLPLAETEEEARFRALAVHIWLGWQHASRADQWADWAKSGAGDDKKNLDYLESVKLPLDMTSDAILDAVFLAKPPKCRIFQGVTPWERKLEALTSEWFAYHPDAPRIIATFEVSPEERYESSVAHWDATAMIEKDTSFQGMDFTLNNEHFKNEFFKVDHLHLLPEKVQQWLGDDTKKVTVDVYLYGPSKKERQRKLVAMLENGTGENAPEKPRVRL